MKIVFTARCIAVTGAIGAGKSTLASRLAYELHALLLSSDAIREALSHKQRRKGERVFGRMHERFVVALAEGKRVVLDSTGMSARFRGLLHLHRNEIVHVHLTLHDSKRFDERELRRTDRPNGPLPLAAFNQSQRVVFQEPPDLTIATDDLSAGEVYRLVMAAISPGR